MSFLSQPLDLFSIGATRSFGGISGYVTISESTTDALEITQHPVQQGAAVSDHAFKKPVSFSIQMQFTDNLSQSLSDIYQSLLTLQSSRTPFECFTPKRSYPNMLLATLGQTTDKKTENVLSINASFQEVIIVPVSTANLLPSQLKTPSVNSGVQDVGNKSILSKTATLFKGVVGP
jgi:hypothetical protein